MKEPDAPRPPICIDLNLRQQEALKIRWSDWEVKVLLVWVAMVVIVVAAMVFFP